MFTTFEMIPTEMVYWPGDSKSYNVCLSSCLPTLQQKRLKKIVQNSSKWFEMDHDDPNWSKITKMVKMVKKSKQCRMNILIFKYIQIYLAEYIYLLKYL